MASVVAPPVGAAAGVNTSPAGVADVVVPLAGAASVPAAPRGQSSGSSGTERDRGSVFCTPINQGRKIHTGDGEDEDGLLSSNIMGMMMMQQRSEQSAK